ncbi:MAG: SatD family protein [Sphaerochaetaceae bacterium]
MKKNQYYTAVLIDVVGSRNAKNRLALQGHLKKVITLCNKLFIDEIDKEVVFSAGDEMQGLFLSAAGAYRYVQMFLKLMYPINIRSGIGTGVLDYHADWDSTELDGPAYHTARDAIDEVHERETQGILFRGLGKAEPYTNALMLAYQLSLGNLKPKSRIIYQMSEYLDPVLANPMSIFREWNTMNQVLTIQQDLCSSLLKSYKEPMDINLEAREPEETIDFWRWGLSTSIAKSLSTHRQSVDAAVKAGHFPELREIEYALLQYLKEEGV